MGSTLRVFIPIVLVFGVVFTLTVVKKLDTTPPRPSGDDKTATTVMPLRFTYTEVRYDPTSDDPLYRHFPGFYEVSDQENTASFWFRNTNPTPTEVQVLGRSCTSCTAARLAVVPASGIRDLVRQSAAGLFPASPFPVPDLLTAIAFAELDQRLTWREFNFEEVGDTAVVPAAESASQPTWGIFQMGMKVTGLGPKSLTAGVGMKTGTMTVPARIPLTVTLHGINPFEITPAEINLGTFPEGATPRTIDLYYWSATRTTEPSSPSQLFLPPPTLHVPDDDPFLTVGEPVVLTAAERVQLAGQLQGNSAKAIPVLGAYRFPVTLYRTAPNGAEPDIGPFEHHLAISGPGANGSRRFTIKGQTVGVVALASGDVLKLGKNGEWNVLYGNTTDAELVSDRENLQLELVPEETTPGFLKATLGAPEIRSGRTYWNLKIVIPPNTGFGSLPRDAAVVLRTVGAKPQKIRIPVQGFGFRRG